MTRSTSLWHAVLVVIGAVLATPAHAAYQADASDFSGDAGRTPPRLSFIDGSVSFARPGAEEWAPARLNTPLAPGDALYAAEKANLEIQVGARAFVRAGAYTHLTLANQDAGFLQLQVTAGHLALDLRSLAPRYTVEVDTPNAVIVVNAPGYYRFDIENDTTTLITRDGGTATVTPAGGQVTRIPAGRQAMISGIEFAALLTYGPPEADVWDRWNYSRTDQVTAAASARYVSEDVYGLDTLDRHGTWNVVEPYGPVWRPTVVSTAWAPYSTGRWIWDPYYRWTWIDDAPWGWAPYHYGRWVYAGNYWGWAPGPVVVTPYYAPALVAFFGGGVTVGVGIAAPPISWVALSWGEPCVPWWGRHGFAGRPWWGGWGGPRVINNTVINNKTIVNVTNIHTYRNVPVRNAVVTVDRHRFGRDHVSTARMPRADARRLRPIHGPLAIQPTRDSLVPASGSAIRPPERLSRRPVVSHRAPHDPTADLYRAGLKPAPGPPTSAPREHRPSRAAAGHPPPQSGRPAPRPQSLPRQEQQREAVRPAPRPAPPPAQPERAPRDRRPDVRAPNAPAGRPRPQLQQEGERRRSDPGRAAPPPAPRLERREPVPPPAMQFRRPEPPRARPPAVDGPGSRPPNRGPQPGVRSPAGARAEAAGRPQQRRPARHAVVQDSGPPPVQAPRLERAVPPAQPPPVVAPSGRGDHAAYDRFSRSAGAASRQIDSQQPRVPSRDYAPAPSGGAGAVRSRTLR